jgi:hypothetical protein
MWYRIDPREYQNGKEWDFLMYDGLYVVRGYVSIENRICFYDEWDSIEANDKWPDTYIWTFMPNEHETTHEPIPF